ncbi:MAG: PAS domain S-box protein [Candidatus Omnitrophota bacterium]
MSALDNNYNILEKCIDLMDLIGVSINREKKVTFINEEGCKILGYKKEELIGRSVFEFIHPDDTKRLLPLLARYIAKKTKDFLMRQNNPIYEIFEYRLKDKNGNWHDFECTANPSGDKIVFISKDITLRKESQKGILEISKFPEENPNPVLRISSDGTVLYKNEATDKILKESKVLENDIYSILPKDIHLIIAKSLEEERVISDLEMILEERTFSYSVVPVKDSGYVNLYANDITERKDIDRQLRMKIADLEKFHSLSVGRELKMIELKKKIRLLEERIKER